MKQAALPFLLVLVGVFAASFLHQVTAVELAPWSLFRRLRSVHMGSSKSLNFKNTKTSLYSSCLCVTTAPGVIAGVIPTSVSNSCLFASLTWAVLALHSSDMHEFQLPNTV